MGLPLHELSNRPAKQVDTLYIRCGFHHSFKLELDENCMRLFARRIGSEKATADEIVDFLHGVMRTMVKIENHTDCNSVAFRAGESMRIPPCLS